MRVAERDVHVAQALGLGGEEGAKERQREQPVKAAHGDVPDQDFRFVHDGAPYRGMRMLRSRKSPCSAPRWQAAQLAALLIDGRRQAAAGTSSCSWRNQALSVMRRVSRARAPAAAGVLLEERADLRRRGRLEARVGAEVLVQPGHDAAPGRRGQQLRRVGEVAAAALGLPARVVGAVALAVGHGFVREQREPREQRSGPDDEVERESAARICHFGISYLATSGTRARRPFPARCRRGRARRCSCAGTTSRPARGR